jgi:hypothetical protein
MAAMSAASVSWAIISRHQASGRDGAVEKLKRLRLRLRPLSEFDHRGRDTKNCGEHHQQIG